MSFSREEQQVISELSSLNTDRLTQQIKSISLHAWDRSLENLTLNKWKNNFTGEFLCNKEAEQNLALWLALHFVFYTDRDVRSLSTNLWWKFIHNIIENYENTNFMSDKTINEKYNYIINNTIIQPLGNCSGSGTNVCYFFRQSNGLKKELFDIKPESEYKYLVLVDDATVSGYQTKENLEKYSSVPKEKKFILTYISTQSAKLHIGDEAQLISSIELDDKSKCFNNSSYVFSRHKNWSPIAKKMCKYYGNKLDPHNPLGYRKGQFTFGFYYNIPNNTLPIFWATLNGWTPLFNRYFSDYNKSEETNSEKFL